jgi:hypothetical protein
MLPSVFVLDGNMNAKRRRILAPLTRSLLTYVSRLFNFDIQMSQVARSSGSNPDPAVFWIGIVYEARTSPAT